MIQLADWVIDMDDGRKSRFRWIDRRDTGLASGTRSPDFHGPGRGAGNSINALLDAHRLTGEPRYLDKADALIARCVHPDDDPAALDLLDAENRWSYTVFLQALGKYLEHRADRGLVDERYEYARAVLLRYATWMCAQRAPVSRCARAARVSDRNVGGAGHSQGGGLRVRRAAHARSRRARRFPRAVPTGSSTTRSRRCTQSPTGRLTRPLVLLLAYGFQRPMADAGRRGAPRCHQRRST